MNPSFTPYPKILFVENFNPSVQIGNCFEESRHVGFVSAASLREATHHRNLMGKTPTFPEYITV